MGLSVLPMMDRARKNELPENQVGVLPSLTYTVPTLFSQKSYSSVDDILRLL